MNFTTTCEVPSQTDELFKLVNSTYQKNLSLQLEKATMPNTTIEEEDFDFILIDENDIIDKVVVGITWGFLEIFLNPCCFGLVQFDRLGGDPLKRRITDQVGYQFCIHFFVILNDSFLTFFVQLFSNLLLQTIANNILESIYALQILFDIDYPAMIRSIYFFQKYQGIIYKLLTFIEMVYIKFWLKFVRQRMISMDDQYIVTCLTAQNLILSSLLSILMVRIGKWLEFGTLPLVSEVAHK